MKRFVTTVVVAGLLIATTASGAVAKTTKIEATGARDHRHDPRHGDLGRQRAVRARPSPAAGRRLGQRLPHGSPVITINWDLGYDTGRGKMWGSEHHDVSAVDGGSWDCRLHAAIVDLVVTGKCVCGTGTLHTWQWRADLRMVWNIQGTEAHRILLPAWPPIVPAAPYPPLIAPFRSGRGQAQPQGGHAGGGLPGRRQIAPRPAALDPATG